MNANPFLGVFFHWLGGLASGSFYVPYRGVRRWSWETYWLVGGVFSWIIAPWVLGSLLTNDLVQVLREAPGECMFWSYFWGAMWGLGGLTFGLTMRYLGMSLGMAVALGYCAAFGTLMPPIFHGEFVSKVWNTHSGQVILVGIGVCLAGIAIAGLAGMSKEREMSDQQKKASIKEFSFKKGVLVATFSGVMSASFSYGLDAGEAIKQITTEQHGTPALWRGLPVLVVVLLGGFTTNFLWCVLLNIKNKTGRQYLSPTAVNHPPGRDEETIIETAIDAPSEEVVEHIPRPRREPVRVPLLANYFFCALAGVTWYMQFFCYTMGETQMGKYGFSSWTLHMASIIIFSTLWGIALREWKGSSRRTVALITFGLATLVASTVVVGYGNYLAVESPATVERLRCEYRVDPLGIDAVQPQLSWEMHDVRRGARQTAYQVLVAGTPEKLAANQGDLWDSGRVDSDQSTHIVYAGQPLRSRVRCHWKVRVWDAFDRPTPWSKPALWTIGLLKPEDVKAKWIGLDGPMTHPTRADPADSVNFSGCSWVWAPASGAAAPAKSGKGTAARPKSKPPKETCCFRGTVTIPPGKTLRWANFLITADDSFELFINGTSVAFGHSWQDPKSVDVGKQLLSGKNCLAVEAANAPPTPAGLMGKLVVAFDTGDPIVCRIDASWKAAAKKAANWKSAECDDSAWPAAAVVAPVGANPWEAISASWRRPVPRGCPLLRKEFDLGGPVRRATLYASALGCYRMYLNGRPVGDDYFTPDWTDYHKRVYYNTYDVTDLVRPNARNAIGGVLGAGWYCGPVGWQRQGNVYGDKARLLVQLEIERADGTIQTVATDGTWRAAFGPWIEGELIAGETYDATKEIAGWDSAGLDDAAWRPAAVGDSIAAKLQAFPGVTVRETDALRPVKISEPKPGVFVFDMGQNFAGFARLKVRGPAGTRVVLRFAEMLNPDGTIYTTNLRGARATDTYVLKGQGEEVWQPRFTFHGFRYVEATGYPGRPTEDAVTGVVVNSDIPLAGQFECSSPMVNRLYRNIVWTQRANFISIPTDCPQRDERLGWTGDAQAFVGAAAYNADVAAFFTKWLVDLDDAQAPDGEFPNVAPRAVETKGGVAAWSDAGTICPSTVYQVYGDRRLLERHYAAMARWVEFCRAHSKDLLRPAEGHGDWLSINADTPKDVIATAYFAHSAKLTADAARRLGKQADARKYDGLFEQIKTAFNKAYVAPDGKIKGDTQTCYVLALAFDLLPPEQRAAAARRLANDIRAHATHLTTGFVGTSLLMPVLSATGNTPLAYRLLLNDTFPSWGFTIKHGATSIWERWDGWTPDKGFQTPGMNSFAHYAFGAVGQWLFQTVAGIDTEEPGYKRLLIRPQPAAGLTWVKAACRSIHGPIATHWKTENGTLMLSVSIPANTTATVCLPVADPSQVTEGGRPAAQSEGVRPLGASDGESRFNIGAGEYHFAMPWHG
jgi:alpha-L-rhamnosidase